MERAIQGAGAPMKFASIAHLPGLQAGAAAADIRAAQQLLCIDFPKDYVELLAFSNGAVLEGLQLYPAEDLPERNKTFEIASYLPSHLLIGDDGGGTGILVSLIDGTIRSSGLGDLNPDDLRLVAPSLQAWIEAGCGLQ